MEAAMNAYPIILAMAPNLPGLVLVGDTREELLEKAPAATADHLDALRDEQLPVPSPTEIELVKVAV